MSDPPESPEDAPVTSEPAQVAGNVAPDGDDTLSRREAAKALGVDERTVRRMAQDGRLTPVAAPDGGRRFRAEEIREVTYQRRVANTVTVGEVEDGETAAALFTLFDEGADPVEAVKRLRLSPRVVDEMYRQWAELRGGLFLPERCLRELCARFPIAAPIRDGEHLVKTLVSVWPKDTCTECQTETPKVCVACTQTIAVMVAKKKVMAETLERDAREFSRSLKELDHSFASARRRRAAGRTPSSSK